MDLCWSHIPHCWKSHVMAQVLFSHGLFFQAVGHWAATLDHVSLLNTAARLVDKALSCGYTGLVMLHGMLSRIPLSSWEPRLYGNYHPSYYGMMSASFHLRSNTC